MIKLATLSPQYRPPHRLIPRWKYRHPTGSFHAGKGYRWRECTTFIGQKMIQANNGGRITNIASPASKRGTENAAAYVASKFVLIGLTQAFALDLAPHKITVYAVCPGMVNTDRLVYWEVAQAKATGQTLEEFRAEIVSAGDKVVPFGRAGEPDDVAKLVAFLASDDASFISGQAPNVNGGTLFHWSFAGPGRWAAGMSRQSGGYR